MQVRSEMVIEGFELREIGSMITLASENSFYWAEETALLVKGLPCVLDGFNVNLHRLVSLV